MTQAPDVSVVVVSFNTRDLNGTLARTAAAEVPLL